MKKMTLEYELRSPEGDDIEIELEVNLTPNDYVDYILSGSKYEDQFDPIHYHGAVAFFKTLSDLTAIEEEINSHPEFIEFLKERYEDEAIAEAKRQHYSVVDPDAD